MPHGPCPTGTLQNNHLDPTNRNSYLHLPFLLTSFFLTCLLTLHNMYNYYYYIDVITIAQCII